VSHIKPDRADRREVLEASARARANVTEFQTLVAEEYVSKIQEEVSAQGIGHEVLKLVFLGEHGWVGKPIAILQVLDLW